MSRFTSFKAILVGVIIFIISQFLYIGVLVRISNHEMLRLMLMTTPSIAVLVSTCLSFDKKFLVALFVIFFGSVICVLSIFIYEYFGFNVDRIGGVFSTFMLLFMYQIFASLPGVFIGIFLSERLKNIN